MRNHWIPDYLRDSAALAVVILVFGLAVTREDGRLQLPVSGRKLKVPPDSKVTAFVSADDVAGKKKGHAPE